MKITLMTISELANITRASKNTISSELKTYAEEETVKKNNRIVGVSPDAAEKILQKFNAQNFKNGSITITANLCGGVGKTTCAHSIGVALRRSSNRNTAIVYIDADPQGSLTSMLTESHSSDRDPTLVDYFEEKIKLKDLLIKVGDNMWMIPSNLGVAWLDKTLSKPVDTKTKTLELYKRIFKTFGPDTKIIQDHAPHLSTYFASSICALDNLDNTYNKNILIPIRSDQFAIQGAEYILKEIDDIKEGFSLKGNFNVKCFFSNIDNRTSITKQAIQLAESKKNIANILSDAYIRYSSEIPKAIMNGANVFTVTRSRASYDYLQLLKSTFQEKEEVVV